MNCWYRAKRGFVIRAYVFMSLISFSGTAVTIPRNAALTQTPVVNDLTSLQNEILALIIAYNSITTKQIAAQLGITGRTVQRHVAAMQKKGVLKREGTNKGKWVVVS